MGRLGQMGLVHDKELGVTLVEGAIVLPLLVLIVFSIMELGLAFKDFLTTDFAAKEGARVGALAGNDPDADCEIVQSIVAGYTGTDFDKLDTITIFQVGSSGAPVGGTQNVWTLPAGADPSECAEWSQTAPLAWVSTDRDVTVAGGSDLDILGVTIETRHDWVTGFPPWRGQIDIVRTAIQRLEPEAFE
jgi:Flp pilus assembly protein TadG